MRIILSETRTTSNTFSHHSSARRTPTPPVPMSFPDQNILKRESFPTICFTPSYFHLVSWRQHKSTPLRDTVSTTSLALPRIVPTLSVPTRNFFGLSLDSPLGPDPAAPHPRAAKPETLPTTLWLPAPPELFLLFWLVMSICSKILWQDALLFTNLETIRQSKCSAVPYWLGLCAPPLAPWIGGALPLDHCFSIGKPVCWLPLQKLLSSGDHMHPVIICKYCLCPDLYVKICKYCLCCLCPGIKVIICKYYLCPDLIVKISKYCLCSILKWSFANTVSVLISWWSFSNSVSVLFLKWSFENTVLSWSYCDHLQNCLWPNFIVIIWKCLLYSDLIVIIWKCCLCPDLKVTTCKYCLCPGLKVTFRRTASGLIL